MSKTPITPEALIDMGFKDNSDELRHFDFYYTNGDLHINVYGDNIVDIKKQDEWITTNATTIEDIKDLIRLFK